MPFLSPEHCYRGFTALLLLTLLNGILKLAIACNFVTWNIEYKGFYKSNYMPEYSGGFISSAYDICLSLYGMNAVGQRNISEVHVFVAGLVIVTISKMVHVYLCWQHMKEFKTLLGKDVEAIFDKFHYLPEYKFVWNHIQLKNKCCGITNVTSWYVIPASCCEYGNCTVENSYREGCFQALHDNTRYFWMKFLIHISFPYLEGFLFIYANFVWMDISAELQ